MAGGAPRLYRRILRLHRALPPALRDLGDRYVKEEFRRHRAAGPAEAQRFLREWEAIAEILRIKVGRILHFSESQGVVADKLKGMWDLDMNGHGKSHCYSDLAFLVACLVHNIVELCKAAAGSQSKKGSNPEEGWKIKLDLLNQASELRRGMERPGIGRVETEAELAVLERLLRGKSFFEQFQHVKMKDVCASPAASQLGWHHSQKRLLGKLLAENFIWHLKGLYDHLLSAAKTKLTILLKDKVSLQVYKRTVQVLLTFTTNSLKSGSCLNEPKAEVNVPVKVTILQRWPPKTYCEELPLPLYLPTMTKLS
ncbi:hypothetical protein DV515_00001542 [Chloebia gouldiae]|uniref:Succinate dehydrogenase assembly factor 3 n=1 Tax=Chloebia gouldiae TaxID=44316 RepID=A0A3L8SZH5_CHLGU|nr:hypothetical protein DV515_00001542 [Chloebia gouldiae]